MENAGVLKEGKIVLGLDFGTTFSGFAYALGADPDAVYTFYDCSMQAAGGGLPYCKAQTSLLYADAGDSFNLRDWGWPAFVKFKSTSAESVADSARVASGSDFKVIHALDVHSLSGVSKSMKQAGHGRSSGIGYFLTLFKLHLTCEDTEDAAASSGLTPLPPGKTAERAITDTSLDWQSSFLEVEEQIRYAIVRYEKKINDAVLMVSQAKIRGLNCCSEEVSKHHPASQYFPLKGVQNNFELGLQDRKKSARNMPVEMDEKMTQIPEVNMGQDYYVKRRDMITMRVDLEIKLRHSQEAAKPSDQQVQQLKSSIQEKERVVGGLTTETSLLNQLAQIEQKAA